MKALRIRVIPTLHFADAPPVERSRIAVLLIAGHHAALAADALRHVEVKSILLTCFQESRGNQRPACQVYAWTMRQSLPAIPIPLLPSDPDLSIDLGAVFRTTYERGRYSRSVDYAARLPAAEATR